MALFYIVVFPVHVKPRERLGLIITWTTRHISYLEKVDRFLEFARELA